jgi:hypothetical protein
MHKLRYVEEVRESAPATKSNIMSIQPCDMFLSNRVMMSKAPTVITLRPSASKGDYQCELAANLQFLTDLQMATQFMTTELLINLFKNKILRGPHKQIVICV